MAGRREARTNQIEGERVVQLETATSHLFRSVREKLLVKLWVETRLKGFEEEHRRANERTRQGWSHNEKIPSSIRRSGTCRAEHE
jgi:hypothetical protein